MHIGGGYMAFHHVAADQCGVARAQLGRQPQFASHGMIATMVNLDAKAVGFHVGDPVLAAAAAGVFPDFYRNAVRRGRPGGAEGGAGCGGHGDVAQGGAA